jgi:hypothetical protein
MQNRHGARRHAIGVIKVGKHKSRDGALQGSVIGARESLVEPGETPRVIE